MKYFCVVSHTHWDREWYMPLEWFKLKLVDLIDHLLATLEKYPAYIFHLDAQTVVLEDYLEYRPSRRETLRGTSPRAGWWWGLGICEMFLSDERRVHHPQPAGRAPHRRVFWKLRQGGLAADSSATSLSCRRS